MTLLRNAAPDVALRFHALADETRIDIVRRLAGGERCVCDLQDSMDAAQSRLSYHLRILKDAGLVTDRRAGRWIHYSLVPAALEGMQAFLGAVVAESAAGSDGVGPACCS
jgi:ArsR family transcriptional regulator